MISAPETLRRPWAAPCGHPAVLVTSVPCQKRLKASGYRSSRVWWEGRDPRGCWQEGVPVPQNLPSPRNNIPPDSRVYQHDSRFFQNNNRGPSGSLGPHSAGMTGHGVGSRCCPRLCSRKAPSVNPKRGGCVRVHPSTPRMTSPR